jgi:ribosomal protein S18 acetylase RimI-like enzyme
MREDFIQFRQALPTDALRISLLYQEVYEGTYSDPLMRDLKLLKNALSSDYYYWSVAEARGEIVASVVYRIDRENRLAKVFGAVVLPFYRGHKITQNLMAFGHEHLKSRQTAIEVIYATTRTVSIEPQKLTQNLGYKRLGIFPNVHKTEEYETHALTAYFSASAFEQRYELFTLHPKLAPLYEIVRMECGLPALPISTSKPGTWKKSETKTPLRLEVIHAPEFVKYRFSQLRKAKNTHDWFFPFQEPNLMLSSADQRVEVFAYLEKDQHCVLIAIHDEDEVGLARILEATTKVLRKNAARYIEFIIRADEIGKIQVALETSYIPSAYFPAMQLSEEGIRYDFVVFPFFRNPRLPRNSVAWN